MYISRCDDHPECIAKLANHPALDQLDGLDDDDGRRRGCDQLMYAFDHACASERMVYPVLAKVVDEYGAYTLENEYRGREFKFKFRDDNACSAVIARFSL